MTFLVKAILIIHENGGKKVNIILKNMKIKVNPAKIMKIHKKSMTTFYINIGKIFQKIKFLTMIKKTLNLNHSKKKSLKNLVYQVKPN